MKSIFESFFILALIFFALAIMTVFYLAISYLIFKTSFNLKNFTQLYVTILFMAWVPILFSTAMFFGGDSESLNKPDLIFMANFVLFYPLIISLIISFKQFKLWSIDPKFILICTLLITVVTTFGFNYPRLLLNYARGISNIPAANNK